MENKILNDDEIEDLFDYVRKTLEKFYKKKDNLKMSRISCREEDYIYFDNRIGTVNHQIEFYENLLLKISKIKNKEN